MKLSLNNLTAEKVKEPNVSFLRQFLWHGTKGQILENILKEGLKIATQPKLGASQQFPQYHYDGLGVICLTNHEGNGCFYATASYPIDDVMTENFEPIVFQIDPKKINKDFLFERLSSEDGSMYRGAKEFDYLDNIQPDAIVGFFRWNKIRRKYEYYKIQRGEQKMKHGIAVREKATKKLVEFLECPTGQSALRILSGRRHNLDQENYYAEEAMVDETEISAIER